MHLYGSILLGTAVEPLRLRVQLVAHPVGLMNLLAVLSCSFLPLCYRSLIPSIGMDYRLWWTSITQERHHRHDELFVCAQSFHHRAASRAKGLCTPVTLVPWPFATMNADVALPDLAACRTRRIRATLLRRVHWLCCGVLHTHILPMDSDFFKSPAPFHQLMESYQTSHEYARK